MRSPERLGGCWTGESYLTIIQSFYDLNSNIIFLGILTRECDICCAGFLLLVAIVLDYAFSDISDTERIQAAKDTLVSQDVLIDIFDRVENFFRRLETYTEMPTTEAIKDIVVKTMVEVLGIYAIVTKEMKQGRANELIHDNALRIADINSEKYLNKLIRRRDIESLGHLDTCVSRLFEKIKVLFPANTIGPSAINARRSHKGGHGRGGKHFPRAHLHVLAFGNFPRSKSL